MASPFVSVAKEKDELDDPREAKKTVQEEENDPFNRYVLARSYGLHSFDFVRIPLPLELMGREIYPLVIDDISLRIIVKISPNEQNLPAVLSLIIFNQKKKKFFCTEIIHFRMLKSHEVVFEKHFTREQ